MRIGLEMIDLSKRSWARVWLATVAVGILGVSIAISADWEHIAGLTSDALMQAITVDMLLPTLVACPLVFLLLTQIRVLAIARDEMEVLATTDSLTGILNRGAFEMMVEAYLERASQAAESSGSFLLIDADHFKSINDTLGHATGDQALRCIANCIKAVIRPSDLVGRVGGEEFGVFLPGTDDAQPLGLAERIRRDIYDSPFPSHDRHDLSVSIGGVHFRNERSYEKLFKLADFSLYSAKGAGRNRVSLTGHLGRPGKKAARRFSRAA